MKKRKVGDISKEELQLLYDTSNSYSDLLRKLNQNPTGGSGRRSTLKRYEIIHNINKEKFLINNKKREQEQIKNLANLATAKAVGILTILVKNSTYGSKYLKQRVLREKLIEYKCIECGNIGEWNGKELNLQLDHINGINNDNRLENLRILCPNCHTQTDNYGSRNINSKQHKKREEVKANKKKVAKEKIAIIKERKKILDEIDKTKFGWLSKLRKKWGVSQTQAKRWIKKYYPEVEYYERKKPSSADVNG